MLVDGTGLRVHLVVIVVVVMVDVLVIHSLILALIIVRLATRTRVVSRSIVLFVVAASSWSTTAARWIAVVVVSSLAIAFASLASLNDRLHNLLLWVEVRVQEINQLFTVFLLHLLDLLDKLCDGVTLSLVPNL